MSEYGSQLNNARLLNNADGVKCLNFSYFWRRLW